MLLPDESHKFIDPLNGNKLNADSNLHYVNTVKIVMTTSTNFGSIDCLFRYSIIS